MSDFDSDSEKEPLPTAQELKASPSNSSNSQKEYQVHRIEKLLKMSVDTKQYVVQKNMTAHMDSIFNEQI